MKTGEKLTNRRGRDFSNRGSQAKAESRKWKAETKPLHRATRPISAFYFLFSALSMNLLKAAVTLLLFVSFYDQRKREGRRGDQCDRYADQY
jgi:hypothetical protein